MSTTLLQEDTDSVGKRIAQFRKQKAMTQKELSEKIGVGRSAIADYERGRLHLNETVLTKLSQALGVSTDEILGIQKIKKQKSGIPSIRIMKRLEKIEALPENKKKMLLKTIDDLIKANTE